jgi:exodeoxyribonuclease VII large subunit
MDIIILPAVVQGAEAAASIATRIREVNEFLLADVMIVGRGGGSVEDLLPFSEECVIEAIHDSQIPVISAVGHEIDWAISDYVADLRAPTPSAAAELVCESSIDLLEKVGKTRQAMVEAITGRISSVKLRIAAFSPASARAQLENRLNRVRMRLDSEQTSIMHQMDSMLSMRKAKVQMLSHKIQALSPLAVLERGYAIVTSEDGNTLKKTTDTKPGQNINLRMSDGILKANVREVEDGRQ